MLEIIRSIAIVSFVNSLFLNIGISLYDFKQAIDESNLYDKRKKYFQFIFNVIVLLMFIFSLGLAALLFPNMNSVLYTWLLIFCSIILAVFESMIYTKKHYISDEGLKLKDVLQKFDFDGDVNAFIRNSYFDLIDLRTVRVFIFIYGSNTFVCELTQTDPLFRVELSDHVVRNMYFYHSKFKNDITYIIVNSQYVHDYYEY